MFLPFKLTKIIRGQVGEVRYARILEDGNLLIGCNTRQQVGLQCGENVSEKISEVVRVGEQRGGRVRVVITGVPFTVSIEELIESESGKQRN